MSTIITKKVAFVLQLIDDFHGKTILKQKFIFKMNGLLVKPIEKEEGLYVFLEPVEKCIELSISGSYYHENIIKIEKDTLDQKEPVVKVRLFGKPGQEFSNTCKFYSGKIENKTNRLKVPVFIKSNKSTGLTFKEILQDEGKTYLICNGFTKEMIVGKTFCISCDNKSEIFVILERAKIKGMSGYQISDKISGNYEMGTKMERVYRSLSDERGYYAIPVNADEVDQVKKVHVIL